MTTKALFSPFTLKNVTFKNRIVMSPMCMYSCSDQDGKVNHWHLTHYTSRAVGQVGLIIVESTAVTPQGRISPQDLGIWDDVHIEGLKKLVDLNHEHGSKIGIQLGHAGRKANLEETIIAPSAIAFDQMKTPEEMTTKQIKDTITAFKDAARRAKEAGFDVIELHGAHGYLLHQFLSPIANHRTDEYGGERDNRYRMLSEVIDAVKSVWDGPLFVRVSANDYLENGLTPDDHVYFAKKMKAQGVDLIDTSSGAIAPAKIDAFPGYQVPYAEKIRKEAGIPTGAVGLILNATQAEEILKNDRADLVFLARELLRDPYWPYHAAKELRTEIEGPRQYARGWNA
ncbi:NADPH2 dehydrogenase [Pullulanibacillus pueri]|uniref:NADPH dehydrogenase n=1 Tax=Pullulanibacillus pueri TaxID=1437324 RepID=A0A8J2ZVH5_9BACL|nr:NADPH dehydrogenase NamA [Pullulanibacillus pueri]MBM7681627.1 NADPH2 dehydrogenase [Pullulanibacillus pueri]GGH79398.1 NADPH dehydrogenase [Pullulanibacillus pueri]